ncbi:hypothetical protein NPIL_315541 [Nephila pilipes]|uniref:Uncharacterized protein n=1 Tax=Nephila pilipes TaxID=299642 RepID=A0A8X6N272_NEPPI|nr:hypothetical protein NPIL_315541 [Nephila pilipes]
MDLSKDCIVISRMPTKLTRISKWSEIISTVLLGMRSAVKKDINATCAELVYGTTIRLPSDLFSTDKFCNSPPAIKPMSHSYVRK